MPEILTESFCERCGTKYTLGAAEEPRKPAGIKKARLLARGFKNFVMSDDAFEDALAAAELDEDRERATEQLEAFHQVFNFCMECRQYTCTQCWNPAEGRCLTCAPLPFGIEKDPLFRLGDLAPGAGTARPPAPDAHPTVVDASAWPTADLARAGANRPTPPADLRPLGLPEWLTQPGAHADAPPSGNGELVGGEQARLMPGEAAATAKPASAETVAPPPPSPAAPEQVVPALGSVAPRDIAAAPEVPLSADIPAEPESAEESAAKAVLEELASDVAANAPLPEIAPPPAWARDAAPAQPAQPAAEPSPPVPAAAVEPAVPGAAFEVKPSGRELTPSDGSVAEKGRKKAGRGARQQMGPLPGMSWQAWRATVAKQDAGEVEEPLEPTTEQPSHALNEGMILEPIVPESAADEWQSPEPVGSEPQLAAPVEPAEARTAAGQPEETMPATRILERLRGAFGRSHAASQAQPVEPVEEPTPAAQLPDAVGFPEPEPLGQAAYAAPQQPFGAPQDAFATPPAGGEPLAPSVEPAASAPARPAWPPVEPTPEPSVPSVEDEPLELPQAAAPQPGERRAEPAPAWQVAPEAPQAPAQEPAWPAAPKQEPAWPPAPTQEPAWPAAPQREPVWPPRAPVYEPPAAPPAAPSWPPQPASTPAQPAPPPAFVARQASGPAAWPPAAQSAAQPSASSVWEESSRGIISRPGSGVQACVSCGLALSASARFCRRCGTRQA
jgi:hypothetical protein